MNFPLGEKEVWTHFELCAYQNIWPWERPCWLDYKYWNYNQITNCVKFKKNLMA